MKVAPVPLTAAHLLLLRSSRTTMDLTPPHSPTSLATLPLLPLELELDILHHSLPPPSPDDDARRQHLRVLSRTVKRWTRWAQARLFDSLDCDLRESTDPPEVVHERWCTRLDGLRALGYSTKQLALKVDDQSGPVAFPSRVPFRQMVMEDYRQGLEELYMQMFSTEHLTIGVAWSGALYQSLFPNLQKLALRTEMKHWHTTRYLLDPVILSSATNLRRLDLDSVYLSAWFTPNAFPFLKTLTLHRPEIHSAPGTAADLSGLFLATPTVEAVAIVACRGVTPATFAQAPSTLKHLLLHSMQGDALPLRRRGAVRNRNRLNTHDLLHPFAHSLETLHLYRIPSTFRRDMPIITSIAFMLSLTPLPPAVASLKKVVLPPDHIEGRDEEVRAVEAFCADKGVELVRWTQEEMVRPLRFWRNNEQ